MSIATGFAVAMAVAGAGAAARAAGDIVAGHESASAAKNAAQIQADSAKAALDYTQKKDAQDRADALAAQKANYEQWAARETRMTPYRAAGQGASQTIAGMLGLPAADIAPPAPPPAFLDAPPQGATTTTTPPPGAVGSRPNPAAPPAPGASAVTGSSNVGTMADLVPTRTVTMRAPNGQTMAVPETDVAHYQQRGAQVVN